MKNMCQIPPVFLVFFLILILSCKSDKKTLLPDHVRSLDHLTVLTEKTEPASEIKMVPEVIFYDSVFIESIAGTAVDDSGRLFVAAESRNLVQIHVFDPGGEFLTTLGKRGEKPGEFQDIRNLHIKPNELVVLDGTLNRSTFFSLDSLEVTNTQDITPVLSGKHQKLRGFDSIPYLLRENGNYLVKFVREDNFSTGIRSIRHYRVNKRGEILSEEILKQRGKQYLVGDHAGKPASFTLDMPAQSLTAASVGNDLFSAWTEEFLVKQYDGEGNYLRAYYSPFKRRKLDPETDVYPEFRHNDQLLRIRKSAEYPEYWPALYSMITDDENHLWVSTIPGESKTLEWWILNYGEPEEPLLAKFRWPVSRSIELINNGSVYVSDINPETGFRQIIKYRVKFR